MYHHKEGKDHEQRAGKAICYRFADCGLLQHHILNISAVSYTPMRIRAEIPAGKIREYESIFEALRREVWEETGVHLTAIQGEETSQFLDVAGNKTIMFSKYCVTQNLSGAYSLILSTFLCEAEGELLERTNETENIRWMRRDMLKEIVDNSPESIFLMHVYALRKYLG